MKKLVLTSLASLLTFVLGLSIFLFWFSYNSEKTVNVNTPIVLNENCLQSRNFPGVSKEISNTEKGSSGYFPVKTFFQEGRNGFIQNQPRDVWADKWFGKFFEAAKEKSLLDISDKYAEIYRFTWLRSFDKPIIVSIEKKADKIELVFKKLDGKGGYEPGKIIDRRKIKISEEEWCEFTKLINEADYWQMPTLMNDSGLDGSSWFLEGVKENRYHIVYRWTPQKTKYRNACLYLLKLSGFDLDKNKDDLY